jgi:hypothetical protein
MTYRIEREKWILYRHTRDFDLIKAVAVNLKTLNKNVISDEKKRELLLRLKSLDHYKERNPEMPLDAINHRINTLAYFMFGYKSKVDGQKKFMFSPLGNLFIKYIDDQEKLKYIFLTMLWSIQFEHPHGGTNRVFQLYPFRLIFKLLRDVRLNYKLHSDEYTAILAFCRSISEQDYDELVSDILNIRNLTIAQKREIFQNDRHTFVNATHEWDYYVSNFLVDAGIFIKTEGELICKLQHGVTPTYRKVTTNFVELSSDLVNYADLLVENYSPFESPLNLNDPERLRIDVIKEIYSFYPKELLKVIGEPIDRQEQALLELPKLIDKYSQNIDQETAYLFEEVLTNGFNMFYNVEAKKIGGSGETDIECFYITKKKKFAVDAKSTQNKLTSLNSNRLASHREKIGAEYTIVITPRYVPAVKVDIKQERIVIILATTFSEFLYNCIIYDERVVDYGSFDDIISSNFGKDVSPMISEMTISKFASQN